MSAGQPQPQLPDDRKGTPIQVLAPHDTVARVVDPSATTRVALPTGAQVVEISISGALHVRFGDSSVNATTSDFFLPSGFVGTYRVPPTATHVAAIFAVGTTSATLYVHKLI
jgi:hypothetical protein